jgi:hypothetical protein
MRSKGHMSGAQCPSFVCLLAPLSFASRLASHAHHLCMHACMHACMYACMYIACMHVCMYACMYVYTYIYVCACMYVCMYVCMYIYVCACMYVCMYVCMYIYVCACMYVCMYVCMCWLRGGGWMVARGEWMTGRKLPMHAVLHTWAGGCRVPRAAQMHHVHM